MTSKTSKIIKIAAAVIAAVVIVCAAIGIYLSQQADAQPHSVWDGVYTKAQAARGAKVYNGVCASCHGEDLTGNGDLASALTGDEFLADWYGQTASDLFIRIHDTMPGDNPGSLSDASDADVMAYILSANGFPAGKKELGYDAQGLAQIGIQPTKPAKK